MSLFVELPVWYIDEVVLDDLGIGNVPFFEVINRNPESGETGVAADSLIELDLATSSADSPSIANTQVYVQVGAAAEVLAYDGGGGGFQSGWDGPNAAVATPDATTLRISIDPTTDFDSLSVVTVHVVATSSNSQVLNESWSFTIEDLSTPILVAARARAKSVVRVTFDEAVTQSPTTSTASALNPANYAFDRETRADDPSLLFPSVPIEAVSVEAVTSSVYDVTLDWEMTPGVEYTVTVTGVEDLFGNAIEAPTNTLSFTGFVPPSPEERDFDLWRQIDEQDRQEDDSGDLRRMIEIFKEVCGLLLCQIDRWTDIIDPDLALENFLDLMLLDLGNPFEFDLDETEKRKLIRILVAIYKQKGTAVGIVNVVRFFLGIEIEVNAFAEEGWDLGVDELGDSVTEGTAILGPGTSFLKYSFEVVSPIALTDEQRDSIEDIANYMKPGHTHLVQIVEPEIPEVIDHLELGLSLLDPDEWILH